MRRAISIACVAVAAACAAGTPRATRFDLEEATVWELQQRMESGRDTARSLAEKYLARIESVDRSGPSLRSVIELNPDALGTADALDAERKSTGARGPLHGIPVLVKDNIETADRMMTTAGSLALEGAKATSDAFVVSRLRAAGAVILGKTNLSEWAGARSTHGVSGWSGRGGQTKNPYALDRSPSGSSSGAGAAVAANLCTFAVGTETDGSIVSPSSVTGLVGIKPTLGLVSRTGIIPIAHSQDTAGPMARTVADAAILLGAMAGADPADAVTKNPVTSGPLDYTRFLVANGLSGARIGVIRSLMNDRTRANAIVEAAIADLKRLGAVIVDPVEMPVVDALEKNEMEVLLFELKADLNRYLSAPGRATPVHSLGELIAFNDQHRDREMPVFGQELLMQAAAKGPLTSPVYLAAVARNRRLSRDDGIDAALAKYHLDALVAPTGGPAWLTDVVNGDPFDAGGPSSSTIAAVAGYPHVTVPAGQVSGLPVGLSFIGGAWSEPTLIRLAYAYEQATKHRRPPVFAATAK